MDEPTQERIMHCQHNEYETITKYLKLIGRLDKPTVIDIGAGDGYRLSNTRDLIEKHGATGLLIDADNGGNPEVVQAFVTMDNIVDLLLKSPLDEIEFLSIDIDGNDYWILKTIVETYAMPDLIMAEINPRFHAPEESFTVPYVADRKWNDDDYFGMSFGAFRKLMEANGYTVVHMEGINALAMRNHLVTPDTPIDINYRHYHGHAPNTTGEWIPV